MIFRRASRCFFITSGIGTLLEVDYSGSAYQEALCHFSVSSSRRWKLWSPSKVSGRRWRF
jgi:hypothetical protein